MWGLQARVQVQAQAGRGGIRGIGKRGVTCRGKGRRGITGAIRFVFIGLEVRVAPSLGFR